MHSLPFSLPGFEVTEVNSTAEQLIICATSQSVQAECPACHEASQRVHSYYQRSPRDLPVSGQVVQLRLRVRRFRCLGAQCSKQTFAKPLPDLIAPIARRTNRLTLLLHVFAIQSGGEPGARLLKAGGTKVSPDTLLRLAKTKMAQTFAVPSILGVDDFAFRRGLTYGTLLIVLQAPPSDRPAARPNCRNLRGLASRPSWHEVDQPRSLRGIRSWCTTWRSVCPTGDGSLACHQKLARGARTRVESGFSSSLASATPVEFDSLSQTQESPDDP